jgi:hypothetical protein
MAKYGLEQFNRKMKVDPKVIFGDMTYLGHENVPEIVFVDENGERFDEQNEEGTLKAVNTGEVSEKYIMIASPNFKKQVDIKVPVSFDEESIPFRSPIEFVGAVTASVYKSTEEAVGTNGRSTHISKLTFPVQVEGVKVVSLGKSNEKPQEEKSKDK